jgi:DNA-binding transcriptional MerR regulator
MAAEGHTIGEVLNRLKQEFDDVSISKIRFLESEGLVRPGRSDSGYRQFSSEDVERLRYVLIAQRDRYLPLKVIKDELSRLDAGLPVDIETGEPGAPAPDGRPDATADARSGSRDPAGLLTDIALDRGELAHASGLEVREIDELIANGIIEGEEPFDGAALRAARVAAELLRRGLEPRHLRAYRLGAEREADRIGQLVAPLLRQRNPESRRTAASRAEELIVLGAQLQRLILEERLSHVLRS